VERGEDAATAARREVREETGVEGLEQLAPLDAISWSFRSRGARIHKTSHYYAFTTAHARTRPQREEGITACRWFTPAQARRRLTHESARSVLDAAVQVAGHLPAGAAVAAEA
jgi:8-oxo-dGTP pyrophosphatase MutT (NUDIX family)